jgi:hypothetical protein
MGLAGDGSAPAGEESKRMDDDAERKEKEQPEAKPPMLPQAFEKMSLEGKKEPSENVSPSIEALELVDHHGPHGDTSRCNYFHSLAQEDITVYCTLTI